MRIELETDDPIANAVMAIIEDVEWLRANHVNDLKAIAHAAFTEGWLMGRDSLGETSQGVIDEAFAASMVAEDFDEREEADD